MEKNMRVLLVFIATIFMAVGANAQDITPTGEWMDEYGTALSISACGDDNTQLCVVLLDVQGESRTSENLAYVNQQIMQADLVAENQWQGTVVFEGAEAEGTLTQVDANTVEIRGCRALLFCETLVFQRV